MPRAYKVCAMQVCIMQEGTMQVCIIQFVRLTWNHLVLQWENIPQGPKLGLLD